MKMIKLFFILILPIIFVSCYTIPLVTSPLVTSTIHVNITERGKFYILGHDNIGMHMTIAEHINRRGHFVESILDRRAITEPTENSEMKRYIVTFTHDFRINHPEVSGNLKIMVYEYLPNEDSDLLVAVVETRASGRMNQVLIAVFSELFKHSQRR